MKRTKNLFTLSLFLLALTANSASALVVMISDLTPAGSPIANVSTWISPWAGGSLVRGRTDEHGEARLVLAGRANFVGVRGRPPFLPVPSAEYLRFRLLTQYGDAAQRPAPDDVLNYLRWCRDWDRTGSS